MSTNGKLEPKIYVACLAAYNNGYLHGEWIDANQPTDDLYEAINAMLAKSPIKGAEEWAIHDYEDFGDFSISENPDLEKISEMASFIEEHGELGAAVLSHTCDDLEDAKRLIEDCYHGEFDNEEDFAYSLLEDTGELNSIPNYLQHYFDYKSYARDLFICDFIAIEAKHKIHVFSNY